MLPYNRGKWHGVRLTLRKTHRWGDSPLLFYYYYFHCYCWCYYYCLKCIIIFLLLSGIYICTILLGRVLGSMLGESDDPKRRATISVVVTQASDHSSIIPLGSRFNLQREGTYQISTCYFPIIKFHIVSVQSFVLVALEGEKGRMLCGRR